MKRILLFVLCLAFTISLAGGLQAVEKKDKKASSKAVQEKKPAPKPKVAAVKPATTSKSKAQAQKKYDDFVDKNKNGIDDRRENLRKKVVPKPVVKSKKKPAASEKKKDGKN